ncbi:MAG: hypothetical protein Q9198_000928 [Flavoplaca austrocitrina]
MQASRKSIAETKKSVEHDHFTYRPLHQERREIRLVQLSCELQVASNGKSVPSLRMHHASFDGEDLPEYTTLSYTWGTGLKGIVFIEDEGKPARKLLVSTNLLDALCHFARLPDQSLETVRPVFWIDQLCINQNDKDEKNHQVAMMTEIFGQAKMTNVWLGSRKATLSCEVVTKYDQDVSRIMEVVSNDPELRDDYSSASQGVDRILSEVSKDDWEHLHALADFCTHPWFERAWVVQEVATSSKVIVHWEGGKCGWSSFQNLWHLLHLLIQRIMVAKVCHEMAAVHVSSRILNTLQTTVSQSLNPPRTYPLIELVENMLMWGTTRATQPEDLIYSTMGIASDKDTCGIEVDYKKHYTEIFTDAALQFLKTLGAQALAWSCQRTKTNDPPQLPSWVPDLRLQLGFMVIEPIAPHRFDLSSKQFSAAGNRNFEYIVDEKREKLSIRTFYVDKVVEVKPFYFMAEHFVSAGSITLQYQAWLADYGKFFDFAAARVPTRYDDSARQEMHWRIPVADRYFDGDANAVRRAGLEVKDWYKAILHPDHSLSASAVSMSAKYKTLIFMKPHVVFLTATGYIGLGHPDTVEGDEVHLVQGSEVPFLLRKTDGLYQLGSQAYVHGIMDGELVEDNTEFPWQEIH